MKQKNKLDKKSFLYELLLVFFFVILFIVIHSIYYHNLFVFIFDQVTPSTTALELWQTKSISLIGPFTSLIINNRQIYFGGISYYIQMIFLLIGRFDPFWSTYAFMVFCGLMIIPLYYGIKKLINKNAAIVMVIIYVLLPFFIESTNCLLNQNFMLSLMPLLVYFMGLFKAKNNIWLFLFISILNGIFFQLHYTYIFVWIGMGIYYFIKNKLPIKYLIVYILGFIIGFSNLIIFELRHNFYQTQTLLLFLSHPKQVSQHWLADYYFLGEFFFAIIMVLYILRKKLNSILITGFFFFMLTIGIYYVTIHASGKNFPKDWYYRDDVQVYKIIKNNLNTIKNFNIFEFYTATGGLPKYFLKRDKVKMNYDDYYHNKYLYVVYKNDQFMKDPAYEVATFSPSKIIKMWKINTVYNLYLLERLPQSPSM